MFSVSVDTSLEVHAEKYFPWGFGFRKSFLFQESSANPVLYLRDGLFDHNAFQQSPDDVRRYTTPFRPRYTFGEVRTLDFSHEREW